MGGDMGDMGDDVVAWGGEEGGRKKRSCLEVVRAGGGTAGIALVLLTGRSPRRTSSAARVVLPCPAASAASTSASGATLIFVLPINTPKTTILALRLLPGRRQRHLVARTRKAYKTPTRGAAAAALLQVPGRAARRLHSLSSRLKASRRSYMHLHSCLQSHVCVGQLDSATPSRHHAGVRAGVRVGRMPAAF